jgi:hypothetical protein
VNTATNAACLDRSVANDTAHRTMPSNKVQGLFNQLLSDRPLSVEGRTDSYHGTRTLHTQRDRQE